MNPKLTPLHHRVIDSAVLLLYGWRPCKLKTGERGWRKAVSGTNERRGPRGYAMQHLRER